MFCCIFLELRTLVLTLLDSLPGLLGATVLLLFFFTVFSIMGVQLFEGAFRHVCQGDGGVNLVYSNLDSGYTVYCDADDKNRDDYCAKRATTLGFSSSYTCESTPDNPNNGMENWDNIFFSVLQVFQIVTLQDWSRWMFDLARTESYTVSMFFVPLIFIVSFFALNLVLAVIVDTYSSSINQVQHEEDYDSTLLEMDDLIQQKTTKRSKPVRQTITYRSYNRKIRSLKEKVKTFEELFKEYNAGAVEKVNKKHELTRNQKMRVDTNRDQRGKEAFAVDLDALAEDVNNDTKVDLYNEDDFKGETWQFSKRATEQKQLRRQMIEDMMLNFNKDLAFEVWLLAKPIKDEYLRKKPMFVKWLHWVAESSWFEAAIIFIIILNTIILAIHYPGMETSVEEALQALNYCFAVLFTIEMLIKLVGLGPNRWFYDKFNVFDGIIVIVSWIEIGLGDSSDADAILAFRALRVLRVLRLLHKIASLRILLNSIIESFEPIFYLLLIVILFLFMLGVLGVQLLGDTMEKPETDFIALTHPWRFDNLWYSMIFMMQLFTADGWPLVMGDAVVGQGDAVAIVFVVCVILGLYIFKNMFLAILINRLSNQDNIQLMIDDLLALAAEKQALYKKDEKTGIKEFELDVKRVRQERMGFKAQAKHDSRIKKMETRSKISGKSLGIFGPKHGLRVFIHDKIVHTQWFEWSINFIIILNCVFLAMDNPRVDTEPRYSDLRKALEICDWIFTVIFILEALLKMFAYGIYESKTVSGSNGSNGVNDPLTKGTRVKQKSADPSMDPENGSNDNDNVRNTHIDDAEDEDEIGPCRNAYLKSWWNRLDFAIVIAAILGLILPEVGFLRGLRAVRPIRVAIRIPLIKVVVKALLHSAPNVLNAILFGVFIIIVLAIVGIHLFSGQFGRCVFLDGDYHNPYNLDVSIADREECNSYPATREWVQAGFHFDNVFAGLLIVFKIGMFSSWYEDLANGMAANGEFKNIIPYNRPAAGLYFIGVIMIMGFFVFNIIISVVVDSFNRIKRDEETNALLTADQVVWVRKRRLMSRFPLKANMRPPESNFHRSIFDLVTSSTFEYFIIGCILVNTIFLMTEHYNEPGAWKQALQVFEIIFIVIYTLEAVLKIYGLSIIEKQRNGKRLLKLRYFSDPWNIFDFLIVVVSYIGLGLSDGASAPAVVVRLLRVARIVRLVKRAPTLRALFLTLVYAAPSLFNIGLLLLVIFFIYGIFGMEMFGKVYPNDGYGNPISLDSNDGLSKSVNFETFGNALLILYRTATNDNWGSILLAAGAEGDLCDKDVLNVGLDTDDQDFYRCGHLWQSVLYFVSFGIFGTLFMINLFVAVILDTYVDNVEFEKKMDKLIVLNEWIAIWKEYDEGSNNKKLKGRLPVKRFISTLRRCPVLVGLMLEALNLRLNVEEAEAEMDYNNIEELKRRSSEIYGKIDFVGPPNPADKHVEVTNDHINALMKTRRLRILCKLVHRGGINEKLVVFYSDALYAIASLVVGPEHRLLPYNNDKMVHISDWWSEQLDDFLGQLNLS